MWRLSRGWRRMKLLSWRKTPWLTWSFLSTGLSINVGCWSWDIMNPLPSSTVHLSAATRMQQHKGGEIISTLGKVIIFKASNYSAKWELDNILAYLGNGRFCSPVR
ncbi:hypothetical protein F5883DRAFT_546625 [Diaporthe sp. PMI_573]|nr:hypothetical protein F5883DRAFT_546625 [Diaporthaceae sp. PMI_573]